jgi:hypothetical protein
MPAHRLKREMKDCRDHPAPAIRTAFAPPSAKEFDITFLIIA